MPSKDQTLIFNRLLRQYQTALNHLKIGQFLNKQQIFKVLQFLGYIDQYVNDQSLQMSHTIAYLLSSKPDKFLSVTTENLFNFIRIISGISNVPCNVFQRQAKALNSDTNNISCTKMENMPLLVFRIGSFNKKQNDKWIVNSQEQYQIKKIFANMNLKRISRQNIEAEVLKDVTEAIINQQKQATFKPQILEKSKIMVKQRQSQVSINKNERVQQRLLMNQSLQKSRLQEQVGKSIQKQLSQCSFKPKINTPKRKIVSYSLSKYINSMNTSFEQSRKQNQKSVSNIDFLDKSMSKVVCQKLILKGKQYERNLQKLKKQHMISREIIDFKQCTFQPKICKKAYHSSKLNRVHVRNTQKSIERMKQGRNRRQFEKTVKERGYPKNVDWTKYINEQKAIQKRNQQTPILCIDLKIFSETKNIKVYQGQALEDVTKKICIDNKVPEQFWEKVESLLKSSIQKCNQVKLTANKLYLNNSGTSSGANSICLNQR